MLPALRRNLPLCEVMDPSQVERIDAASMAILEEVGVVFRDPIALADWRRAGADVRGERVHLDRGLVRELIATIPATFTYRAQKPRPQPALRRAPLDLRADDGSALPARPRRRAPLARRSPTSTCSTSSRT